MTLLIRIADTIAEGLGALGKLALLALILSMCYEVVARYAFGAPTLWAFDISYMLNGSIFALGAAYALRRDAHVRIDFLAQQAPLRVQQLFHAALYLLAMAPLVGMLAWIASSKAWKAFVSGEVESVSPWAPLVWPFYAVLAIGLIAFALQLVAEGLRYAAGRLTPGAADEQKLQAPVAAVASGATGPTDAPRT